MVTLSPSPAALPAAGTCIYSMNGQEQGMTTGGVYFCRLTGCGGRRIAVRWPDGKITHPCLNGMTRYPDGAWQIGSVGCPGWKEASHG